MRRVFILTFMITLILFFTTFGICESYIAMQNTMSKDKITSVMEGFIDKEKGEIKIHFFGKEFLKFPISEISVPHEFSAFVPPYIRALWIALEKISPTSVDENEKSRPSFVVAEVFRTLRSATFFLFRKKEGKMRLLAAGLRSLTRSRLVSFHSQRQNSPLPILLQIKKPRTNFLLCSLVGISM